MERGFNNLSYLSHAQFQGGFFICIFFIGAIFILHAGIALADDAAQISFEKFQPEIKSKTDFGQLPLCRLNLTLTGVLRGEQKNLALIKVGEARDKLFMVGDTISPNIKLLAVDLFGAIISHDGIPERLEFGRKASLPSVAIPDAPVRESEFQRTRLSESGLQIAFIPTGSVQHLGNNIFSVKRSLIQDQVRSGVFFANAKLEHDNDGGFRVTEIIPGSLYDTLRLQDGDTISSINGRPFNSFVDLTSLFFEQQDRNKTAQIQVRRGDSLNNFQLNFQ